LLNYCADVKMELYGPPACMTIVADIAPRFGALFYLDLEHGRSLTLSRADL
jgi:hypothetical protein